MRPGLGTGRRLGRQRAGRALNDERQIELVPGLLRPPAGLGENAPGTVLPIAPLIRDLAARLDQADLAWAVLRNAKGLPDFTRYDLDVLTLPRHLPDMVRIVGECAHDTGWRIAGRIQKRHYTCLLLRHRSAASQPFFLPLDLFTALEFRGLRYLAAETVLQNRIRTPKGIWTVPPGIDAAVTLLKELLPHRVLKENSRAAVQAQAAADPQGFRSALVSAMGMRMAGRMSERVRRGEWSLSPAESKELRKTIRQRSPGWRWAYLHALLNNVAHLFRPSLGLVVCLAGADGSGKTTLAQGLFAQTFKRPFKACRYLHGNAIVLPRFRDIRAFLRRLVGRPLPVVDASGAEIPLKGMMAPIPAWKSIALATYYALDLVLARARLRRWRGQWTLVVMDRSFYDFYYQLGHRRCPHWVLNGLARMVPKPDLLLCIAGDAELIHARKPELTVEEIRIEQNILSKLAERLPFARRLDGSAGTEAMIDAGRREIDHLLEAAGRGGLRCWSIGGRPLLAYAEGARDRVLRSLDMFPRTTIKRAAIHGLIRLLIAMRLEKWAAFRCTSASDLLSAEELESLLNSVRAAGGGGAVDGLLTWPAQLDRRRLYLVFRAQGSPTVGVVKIGEGEFNVRQLRNEADALGKLAATPQPFSLPKVLFGQEWPGGRAALALGGFPAQSRRVPPKKAAVAGADIAAHLRARTVPAARLRIRDCDWFTAFCHRVPALATSPQWVGRAAAEIEVGFAHGDLGPGNMRDDGSGGVFLFDWENASVQAPILTDAVGFWLACRQRSALRHPVRVVAALRGHFSDSPDQDLLSALAFLCAHGNLAAIQMLECWT